MKLPTLVMIGVSHRCNLHCLVCDQEAGPDGLLMEWGLFERTLPLISAGCEVALFGAGEPLLHPRFLDMVRVVVERGGVPTAYTNGMFLSAEVSAELYAAGMRTITISIYGADAETHERLQPGSDSEQVWRNVADCIAAGIAVNIATTVIDETIPQLLPIAQRVHGIGGRNVTWARLQPCSRATDPLQNAEAWDRIDSVRRQVETLPDMRINDGLGPRS